MDEFEDLDEFERELNRMLTVAEAAELLGVSKTTIRRYSNQGKLKSYRIGTGKHRRFRKKDVLDLIDSSRVE